MKHSFVLILLGLLAAGCDQQSADHGATSLCGFPIEVSSSDGPEPFPFDVLEDSTPTYLGSTGVDLNVLYIWTRFDELM